MIFNSESIGLIQRLDAKNIQGPLIHSDNCNLTISDTVMKSISNPSINAALIEFHKSIVSISRITLEKITATSQIQSAQPIINFDDATIAQINMLNAK